MLAHTVVTELFVPQKIVALPGFRCKGLNVRGAPLGGSTPNGNPSPSSLSSRKPSLIITLLLKGVQSIHRDDRVFLSWRKIDYENNDFLKMIFTVSIDNFEFWCVAENWKKWNFERI